MPFLQQLDLSANKLGTYDDPDLSAIVSQFTAIALVLDLIFTWMTLV